MTDWLDEDEQRTWMTLCALVEALPHAIDTDLQQAAGITRFEYFVMVPLSERADRTLRMSDLAMLANGSLSRLSHVARRLEAKGLLRREPDPADGRFTNAVLTDEGMALMRRTAPGHVQTVRRLVLDPLADHHALRTALEAVLEVIDPTVLEVLRRVEKPDPGLS